MRLLKSELDLIYLKDCILIQIKFLEGNGGVSRAEKMSFLAADLNIELILFLFELMIKNGGYYA
ncbi:MAG TPA: hypothetical protein ENO29_07460 [Candidatus Aminicenantes bacterium]|nr:MAG: hypothetical protein C0168_00175 [Candidatus Aminicenantes bacterium]HEK86173.1 hypothetical protein [Candidatus Aminicenantes bacterium]